MSFIVLFLKVLTLTTLNLYCNFTNKSNFVMKKSHNIYSVITS